MTTGEALQKQLPYSHRGSDQVRTSGLSVSVRECFVHFCAPSVCLAPIELRKCPQIARNQLQVW